MQMMPGESVLAQLSEVTLTNYRVQLEINRWGEKRLTTIGLDDLTSSHIESHSKPFWLVLGILVAVVAFLVFNSPAGALTGLPICSVWFFTRRRTMVLRSASEKIEVPRSFGRWRELEEFIHKVQATKSERWAVLAGQKEAKPSTPSETATPLRSPEQSHADNSKPLTQPAEQKAEILSSPGPVWGMGSSSFTFSVKVDSSSAAPAPTRTSPEVTSKPSSKELDASTTQIDQGSERTTVSESATPETSAETLPTTVAPEVVPVAVETRHADCEVPSQNLASELLQHPKTHSTAVLIACIGITAGIVFAVVFAAMHWFSTSPRNPSQAVSSGLSRNRELSGTAVLNLAAPGIVSIEAFDEAGLKKGSGVGFLADGTSIITNYRVIRGSNAVKARFQNGDIADVLGVLGHDVGLNVAVLRIGGGSASSAPLGDSGPLQIGSRVFAVCGRDSQNPLSSGQVSGIRGDGLIQTSIPLGPSSGCPLLNAQGEVVGIAVTGVPGSPNRNFVVPINWVKNYIANTEVSSLQDLIARNTVVQTLVRSTLSVPARQRQSWSFVVDGDRMANPELVGSFSSTGGLGSQVRFLVVTGENQELYDSGRTTGEAVRVSLPPGKCMIVFDNSESLVFARNVTADFSLHYVR